MIIAQTNHPGTGKTGRAKYIALIVVFALLAAIAIFIFLACVTSGQKLPACLMACFLALMLFGIYRAVYHLRSKPEKKLSPTHNGVEYNVLPVSPWKVVGNFFNPLHMHFRTALTLFVIAVLLIMVLSGNTSAATWLWIVVGITVLFKGWLLTNYLKLNKVQNRLGEYMLEWMDYHAVDRHDVTLDTINSPGATVLDVISPIEHYVNILGTYDDYENNVAQFSPAQRHILAVNKYVNEVLGDGHYEYFTSAMGMAYKDALEGLRAIGAEEYAEILEAAIYEFDGINNPQLDREKRTELLEDLDLDFEAEDEAFYALDEFGENIEKLQMDYIRSHPQEFIFHNPNSLK